MMTSTTKKDLKLEFSPEDDKIFFTSARKPGESPAPRLGGTAKSFRAFLRKDNSKGSIAGSSMKQSVKVPKREP
jgi:hypothetical protein